MTAQMNKEMEKIKEYAPDFDTYSDGKQFRIVLAIVLAKVFGWSVCVFGVMLVIALFVWALVWFLRILPWPF